jgi:hypothetical protein
LIKESVSFSISTTNSGRQWGRITVREATLERYPVDLNANCSLFPGLGKDLAMDDTIAITNKGIGSQNSSSPSNRVESDFCGFKEVPHNVLLRELSNREEFKVSKSQLSSTDVDHNCCSCFDISDLEGSCRAQVETGNVKDFGITFSRSIENKLVVFGGVSSSLIHFLEGSRQAGQVSKCLSKVNNLRSLLEGAVRGNG